MFDCAAQGRLDAFFLSGAQIDGSGNINLLGLGGYPALRRRFAGCFGAPFMAAMVPNLVLFREDHDPRVLVERVDFVSAATMGAPGVWRRHGPRWLLTGRCLFRFEQGSFVLDRLHPGESVDGVRRATGFAFRAEGEPRPGDPPSSRIVGLIRGQVCHELAEVYPEAARLPSAAA